MDKTLKNILVVAPSVALAVVLLFLVVNLVSQDKSVSSTSLGGSFGDVQSSQSISDNTSTQSKVDTQITDQSSSQISATKTLSVSPYKCIGCGKCVRTDPEHFSLSGRTASVISNDNLTSSKLTSAIYNCPGDAISLN